MKNLFFNALWDFLLPPRCLGCKKEGAFLCADCLTAIQPLEQQNCPICKQLSPTGKTCAHCRAQTALDGLTVAASYQNNPLLKTMIKNFKYRFNENLSAILGMLLANSLKSLMNQKGIYLVPVPLHFLRRWRRGFNQAQLLTDQICRHCALPVRHVLKRVRHTAHQATLKRQERLINVRNAFRSSPLPPMLKFLLIDDVATTLSTLNECARALKARGAREVWGAVLARG